MKLKNLNVTYRSGGQWSVSGGTQTGIDDHAFAMAAALFATANKDDDVKLARSLPPSICRHFSCLMTKWKTFDLHTKKQKFLVALLRESIIKLRFNS